MIKEAIEKIESMAQPIIKEIGGETFAITADGSANQIRPEIDAPATLTLHSLDSLVKLVRTEASQMDKPLYITVPDHMTAQCFTQPKAELRRERQFYYKAAATDVPGWEDRTQFSFDEAIIAMRTQFQASDDADYALRLLSEITSGAKVTYNDNGVATTVVTQKGIALQGNETIRPIVNLKPYRTFQEVEQPASDFLIRINERGINFIAADGGMWKLHARENIKAYLDEALKDEAVSGTVIIAL